MFPGDQYFGRSYWRLFGSDRIFWSQLFPKVRKKGALVLVTFLYIWTPAQNTVLFLCLVMFFFRFVVPFFEDLGLHSGGGGAAPWWELRQSLREQAAETGAGPGEAAALSFPGCHVACDTKYTKPPPVRRKSSREWVAAW